MLIYPFEILGSSIRYLPSRHVRYPKPKLSYLLKVLKLFMFLALS